jgi:hypothetical protein
MRLALLLVVACGDSKPPARVPLNHIEPAPRDTPAPSIDWKDTRFAVARLPALARGGEVAVVAVEDGDGGRGFPNLRLELRDRSDRVLQSIQVLVSNDFEKLAPDGKPGNELARRIADANHELAVQHGLHDLVPLHALEIQKPTDQSDPHLAIGDGLDVDWSKDHLHVFVHNQDRPFITLDGKAWLAKPQPLSGGTCENPAFLAGAYHVDEEKAIVLELGYRGTDTCWEPGHQWHVVAW